MSTLKHVSVTIYSSDLQCRGAHAYLACVLMEVLGLKFQISLGVVAAYAFWTMINAKEQSNGAHNFMTLRISFGVDCSSKKIGDMRVATWHAYLPLRLVRLRPPSLGGQLSTLGIPRPKRSAHRSTRPSSSADKRLFKLSVEANQPGTQRPLSEWSV
eukprot:6210818-Pleurochrysis_carterae.AAC.4